MSEVQEKEERFWRRNNPVAYGVAISSIILLGYLIIGFRQQCIGTVCETNFQIFWESDPNEIGDTLAGLFSALAFVWIIVTVFLQSIELREQRKEIRQQREASQDMARAMESQLDMLSEERAMRAELGTAKTFEAFLSQIRAWLTIERHNDDTLCWLFDMDYYYAITDPSTNSRKKSSHYEEVRNDDDFFLRLYRHASRRFKDKQNEQSYPHVFRGKFSIEGLERFREQLQKIFELAELLPEDQKIRLNAIRLPELDDMISRVICDPNEVLPKDWDAQ